MKNNEAVTYSYDEEKSLFKGQNSDDLHTTLPIDELIGLFATEISEIVDYDSFEYEHARRDIHIFHGALKLHKCQYKIKDSGLDLGQITITRKSPFKEEEMIIVERALGALSIHLNNAVASQSELENEKSSAQ